MSKYTGFGRTNHVALRDEQAYDHFKAAVALLGGSVAESRENGRRVIAAFGHDEDGNFRLSVGISELVASGYVSRHAGSRLDATRPEYLAVVADPELNEDDRDADDDCDVLHELYPLLAPGQVLVVQRVGHEGLLYVNGYAEAINEHGQRVSMTLDDIFAKASAAFGVDIESDEA